MQATLAEAEAADGERKTLGEQLAAAKKAAAELETQVGRDALQRREQGVRSCACRIRAHGIDKLSLV